MKYLLNGAVLAAMVTVGAQAADKPVISKEDMHCLVQNIYFEARNQSDLGQLAVAMVTLNRVRDTRYPNTVCGVVWQPKQFSWTHDGKPDEPGDNVLEQEAWNHAYNIADIALYLDHDPVQGATMFHGDYVEPYWSDDFEKVVLIDNHIFYK